jgi:phenylacetaldehyde dehydrogenase
LFVQEKVFDKVVSGIAANAAKIKLGVGMDAATEMGPMVSDVQHGRVKGYLKCGLEEGARALTGGSAPDGKGYFVNPTVLVDTKPDMKVVREEIFGPVLVAIPFKEVDDKLIATANDTIYGLAAGVWSRDIAKANQLANALKAGSVWINCYHVFDAALPFGGYKQSGWGREMGQAVLSNYLEAKAITSRIA